MNKHPILFKTLSLMFVALILLASLSILSFIGGYSYGYLKSSEQAAIELESFQAKVSSTEWGGPDLWEAVNQRREMFGVNPLIQRDELCTIASIRLNELLDGGKLDGHEGFSTLSERRSDLEWIFDKYESISEFLVSGAQTPSDAVELWENTLGHKKLLNSGEYVWGCIYGQDSFGVAITAY